MPTVAIIATGGTIAMTSTGEGAVPTESIDQLLESYQLPSDEIDIRVEQVLYTDSSDLTLDDLVELSDRIRAVADDVDGIVVLHGTDTIEETSYYLDVVLDLDIPIVLTGAQRRHDEVGSDGPANVQGAVRAAAHTHVDDGSYVYFTDQLHAARPVTKQHSSNLSAYDSGEYGPIAEQTPDGFWFYREPKSLSVTIPCSEMTAEVDLVSVSTDTDAGKISDAVERGVDGIVIEALGLGNIPGGVMSAVEYANDYDVVVVVTTRCRSGVVSDVYGSEGGGKVLSQMGVLFESYLSAHKARIKLLVALTTFEHLDDIEDVFDASQYDGHGYVGIE